MARFSRVGGWRCVGKNHVLRCIGDSHISSVCDKREKKGRRLCGILAYSHRESAFNQKQRGPKGRAGGHACRSGWPSTHKATNDRDPSSIHPSVESCPCLASSPCRSYPIPRYSMIDRSIVSQIQLPPPMLVNKDNTDAREGFGTKPGRLQTAVTLRDQFDSSIGRVWTTA